MFQNQTSELPTKNYNKSPYIFIKRFVHYSDFQNQKKEMKFSLLSRSYGKAYDCAYYRCNVTKKNKENQCPVRFMLRQYNNETYSDLFQTDIEHSHPKFVINDEIKDEIIALKSMKASNILRFMKDKYEHCTINVQSIYTILRSFNAKQIFKLQSYSDLDRWLTGFRIDSKSIDDVILLGYCVDSNIDEFNAVFSTKRLLSLANQEIICSDTTYKLNWEGYPVSIVGTFDALMRFHLIGIQISTNEKSSDFMYMFKNIADGVKQFFNVDLGPKYIMSDAAGAIWKGYKNAFPDVDSPVRLMCYFHVIKAIKSYKYKNASNKILILNDIRIIRQCVSDEMFSFVSTLFIKKWVRKEPDVTKKIQSEWFEKNRNWFYGANLNSPGTNNGLEGFNRNIKRNHTFRERYPLTHFKEILIKLLTESSMRYDSNSGLRKKTFEMCRQYTNIEIAAGESIHESGVFEYDSETFYVKSSKEIKSHPNEITDVDEARNLFRDTDASSFDDYVRYYHGRIYEVKVSNKIDWENTATCTCDYFYKNKKCKHILAVLKKKNKVSNNIV